MNVQSSPLVNVIIPVYNVSAYVREAIDSVINQTYENLEIIIVDDGSTDDSGKICDEYKSDTRVKVVHQKTGVLVRQGIPALIWQRMIILHFWIRTMHFRKI